MKYNNLHYTLILSFLFLFSACSTDDDVQTDPDPEPGNGQVDPPAEAEPLNLADYDNGSGVMMQTFYWDVEPRHEWWTNLSGKVEGWANAGINRLWLPVATKGQSGGYSMGYDPSDYFDFGEYDQHGTVPTRFGTREELEALIDKAHANGLEVIADIVINHNSGGGLEYNPYRERDTYTLFNEEHGNASGMFNRTFENFYPNSTSPYDEGSMFYPEQNLDHHQDYVQDWLWNKENSVAKYYKNVMGFDGWRFDYVQGYEPWVITEWMEAVGGFAVGENWDGNAANLESWVEEARIPAFDFAAFYKMEEAFDRFDDLNYLNGDMLRKNYPELAVTFVANHDTEKEEHEDNRIAEENKLKSYAYILTHDGYPTIFYSDYENEAFQEQLNQLILIHNTLATGEVEVLYVDQDEYVMKRTGTGDNPGLILYITTNNGTKRRSIDTDWNDIQLMDYSNNTSYSPVTDESGAVLLEAPGNGYAVWSITE